ncbi:DMT family transporter [Roseibium sp. SCP14]|uniref:DMT family transporter n=1 Tax=Roseibium sp. SCP14 TaxID=3141375 RepID=UPI0033354216
MQPHLAYFRPENTIAAIGLAIAGVAAFTPIFAVGKISDGVLPVVVLVWLRFLGGAITIGTIAVVKKVPLHNRLSDLWKLHLMRAVCAVSGLGCSIYASSVLPLADATAISLTKGVVAIALAGLILKEVISRRHWIAGAICIIGALMVVRSTETVGEFSELALSGVISALMAAVFMACESLIIRYIAQREDTVTILAYVNVFAAILLAGPVLWLIVTYEISWHALFTFAWIGPLAIFGQAMNISAYRRAGAATLAPVYYSSVVMSAVVGYIFWTEIPTFLAALGALLIIVGGLVLMLPVSSQKTAQTL